MTLLAAACSPPAIGGGEGVAGSFSVGEDDCADDESSACGGEGSGVGVAAEIGSALFELIDDGPGRSVLNIEDGPTGILPPACPSCLVCPPPSPCWLTSVELLNLEAILTYVYYLLVLLDERVTLNSASNRQMAIIAAKRKEHGPAKEEMARKG